MNFDALLFFFVAQVFLEPLELTLLKLTHWDKKHAGSWFATSGRFDNGVYMRLGIHHFWAFNSIKKHSAIEPGVFQGVCFPRNLSSFGISYMFSTIHVICKSNDTVNLYNIWLIYGWFYLTSIRTILGIRRMVNPLWVQMIQKESSGLAGSWPKKTNYFHVTSDWLGRLYIYLLTFHQKST